MISNILQKLYSFQFIFNICIGLYFVFSLDTTIENSSFEIGKDTISTLLLVVIFILNFFRNKSHVLDSITNWLSIISVPYLFGYFLTEYFYVLSDEFTNQINLLQILYLLLYLVFYLPFSYIELSKLKSPITRLISIAIIFLSFTAFNDYFELTHLSPWLQLITNSRIIIAIAFSLIAFILIKKWSFHHSFNLKTSNNSDFKIIVSIALLLFGIYFAFFEQFIDLANSWTEIFWNWGSNFNSTFIDFNFANLIKALYAGILEETIRFLNISILLIAFRNLKTKVPLTVFISAFIFGIGHYAHLLDKTQNFYNISLQVISAFGVGCFLATAYLYTGKIWLIIGLHTLFDYVGYSMTSLGKMQLGFFNNSILQCLIITFLPILVTILMLLSKNRKAIDRNAIQFI